MTLNTYDIATAVTAFTTTREGGYSCGSYATFNVNKYCGDNPDHVELNRKMLCSSLGIDNDKLVIPHQTHSDHIEIIDDKFLNKTLEEKEKCLEGCDSLITDIPKVCICVSTADCIPIIIYDTTNKIAAVVHAGWRGTVARITEKTIATLKNVFGTKAQDCKSVIGPGISLDCFEVGNEVYESFERAGFDMTRISKKYPATNSHNIYFATKWHIDLWKANEIQLIKSGLSESNIQTCGICTYTNYTQYFSARRMGINSGRILTGIMMNK